MSDRPGSGTVDPGAEARNRRRHRPLHLLRFRKARPRIVAYHGFGTPEKLFLKGRVLRDPGTREVRADDGVLRNLKNVMRRALTDEIPFATVRARLGRDMREARADSEGYFDFELPLTQPLPFGEAWHEVKLELIDPIPRSGGPATATARVLVPLPGAEFGVISDIDDTVVRTEVLNVLRMLRIVLLTNAHSRMPFDHVDALYQALKVGPTGDNYNPIFYVSSSPWNFYDLLEEFFRVHDIPLGPLFLRDWNFSPRRLTGLAEHQAHKLSRIRRLFDTYPELRWVLIGDSGQEDPEIYREAVREYPGRVLAIYIRDVTTAKRNREVYEVADEVKALGVPMLLLDDKTQAAAHAVEHGLIARAALEQMLAEDAQPEPGPSLLEKVINPEARGE